VKNLGLIVVDEEHEPSYKQGDAPRYNARDVAVMRGHMEKCAVVLGTATPALESYCNALSGKYGLARLPHRVDHRKMPVMHVVDMRIEAEREGHVNVFSRELIHGIQQRLDRAEQTMLFLNRRGYATSLVCPKCGFVAQCDMCSVAMTYHRQTDELICHICGVRRKVPKQCPNQECRDPAFRFAGFGTQRVESVMAKIFPKARVRRMDSDTTTGKDSHRIILGDFRTGKIDILVGTQMIAKGLHFPNVTLVGVLMADMSLHMPDFPRRRADVPTAHAGGGPGRARRCEGRSDRSDVHAASSGDPGRATPRLRGIRRSGNRVPARAVVSAVRASRLRDDERARRGAGFVFKRSVRQTAPDGTVEQVILAGPAPAPLARAKGFYRYQVILRAPTTKLVTAPLKKVIKTFKWPEGVSHAIDVDAVSLIVKNVSVCGRAGVSE